jgi:hypothetical protein
MEESPRGWYNVTTFSIVNSTGQSFNGMQTIFGYHINPHLGAGLGFGIERFAKMPMYDSFTANLTMLPVFADLRYTVLKSKVSPVIALNLGYKFLVNIPSTKYVTYTDTIYSGTAWNTWYYNDTYNRGGWFLNAEIGVKLRIIKRFSLNGSVGYSLWSVSGNRNTWLYQFLPASGGGVKETLLTATEKTLAITHTFLFRIGFGF